MGIIAQTLPFILGVLLGAGITRNKYFFYIMMGYVILLFISVIFQKANAKYKAGDKIKTQGINLVNWYIDKCETGIKKSEDMFDKLFKHYTFYITLASLIILVYLGYKRQWLYFVLLFFGSHIFIIQNQIWRKLREVKNDGIKSV